MQNITIGRYENDPEAQGVIRPGDDSWQLVIDKEGIPHLYVRVNFEPDTPEGPKTGLFCVEDMLIEKTSIRDLMKGTFGGKLGPKEEEEAFQEHLARKEVSGIPCPK